MELDSRIINLENPGVNLIKILKIYIKLKIIWTCLKKVVKVLSYNRLNYNPR